MCLAHTLSPYSVDIVYESVGGSTFDTCVRNLAVHGRLIVIGAVSGYQDQAAWTEKKGEGKSEGQREGKSAGAIVPLPMQLLQKSTSIRGFFLLNFADQLKPHALKLAQLYTQGKLRAEIEVVRGGLGAVPEAIDLLYAGKNKGKIVVEMGGREESVRSRL